MFKLKTPIVALVAAGLLSLPMLASAQTTPVDLLKELQALKTKVEQLEKQLNEQAVNQKVQEAKQQAQAAAAVDPAEFNRVRVKAEAIEDNIEAQNLKGFKISGSIDPTFIVNRAQKTAGINFLNNFTGDGTNKDKFAYDNSFFGTAVLDFQKELDGGTQFRLTLAPHKSTGSGWNLGSIVHEASVSVPIDGLKTRLIAGQLPDWSGYEFYFANQTKLVTHNMMFDFLAPNFYQGVGFDITVDKWQTKALIGNMNKVSGTLTPGKSDPILTYRVDYSKGEFQGFGFAGQHGKFYGNRFDNFEVDTYFIRGPLTMQGQLAGARLKNGAANGDSYALGLSALGAYKLTPRFEAVARFDYIKNQRNGGGLLGQTAGICNLNNRDVLGAFDGTKADVACNDGRNGFGPGMQFVDDGAGSAQWEPTGKGVNRSALAVGFNYLFNANTTFKGEYRLDRASAPAFLYNDGNYRKNNSVLGLGLVVSF